MLARIVHCTTWAMTCTLSNESWQMHNSTKLVTVLSWAWLSFLFQCWKFPFSKMLGTDQEPSCCLKHQQETTVNIDRCMHDTKLVFFSIVNTWRKKVFTGTMWMVIFKFCLAERSYWKLTINTEQLSQTYACTDFALAGWGLPFIWNCSNWSQFGFMQTEGG